MKVLFIGGTGVISSLYSKLVILKGRNINDVKNLIADI